MGPLLPIKFQANSMLYAVVTLFEVISTMHYIQLDICLSTFICTYLLRSAINTTVGRHLKCMAISALIEREKSKNPRSCKHSQGPEVRTTETMGLTSVNYQCRRKNLPSIWLQMYYHSSL